MPGTGMDSTAFRKTDAVKPSVASMVRPPSGRGTGRQGGTDAGLIAAAMLAAPMALRGAIAP